MKKLKKIFVVGLLVYVSACNSNSTEDNAKENAEKLNEAKFNRAGEGDAKAITDAYLGSLYEIRVSDTVARYGTYEPTRSLAKMMGERHEVLNSEIENLASKKAISLPQAITEDQLEKMNKLKDYSLKEYDSKYLQWLIDDHKKAIDLYEKNAENCTDAEIKSWFSSSLPELRRHLDSATIVQTEIEKKSK